MRSILSEAPGRFAKQLPGRSSKAAEASIKAGQARLSAGLPPEDVEDVREVKNLLHTPA
jgi:hypothetical protein